MGNLNTKTEIERKKKELEEQRLKKEKEQRSIQFSEKLVMLAEKTVEFENEFGVDSPFTIVLSAFFDAALQMQAMMKQLDAINLAVDCLGDAITFLDNALEYENGIYEKSLESDHGFFARRRAKRLRKRAMRNNYGRIMQIFDNMTMNYKLIVDMSTWMGKLSGKMSKSMNKLNKIKRTNSSGATVACTNGAREFLAKRGVDTAENGTSAPASPDAPVSKPDASTPPAGGSGLEGL
ncbi:MAG: hypothetical protein IJ515_01675 [Clostridia bacterium]|nr:hypothetical protein [Clostridia bacterium]